MRVIVYQASDTSALSKNFTRKDFKCPCGCTRQMVDSELVEKLQAIRDKLGKAIKVTSGYRCITHNASKTVGGSPNSKHRYGMAADWRMVDRSINPVALGIIAAQYFKAVGIYWYDGCAIVHTDTRDAKATWLCDAPRHHLPEVHSADHPQGLHRGCKPCSHEDAPAAAGADPGRHFRRGHRERSAESTGGAWAGCGRHLRPRQLEGHFRGFQVPVKHLI